MRPSNYISIIPINGCHSIAYNSLNDRAVVFKNRIVDFSHDAMKKMHSEEPDLFNKLVDSGFFIEDDVDEFGILKEMIRKTDDNSDSFILHVNPTLDCNFHCWYCYENHIPGSIMNSSTIDSLMRFINRTLKSSPKLKSLHLGFFGGEPLIGFEKCVRPLMEYTKKLCDEENICFTSGFTSNGYLITPDITDFLKDMNTGFQITLDGGPSHHDKTRFTKGGVGSFDKILDNIILLSSKGIEVIVRVNYTGDNIDSVLEIFECFSAYDKEITKKIRFDFQRVWQDRNHSFDDTETEIDIIRKKFRDAGYIVLNNYIPHNVLQSCYGDKINHVLINYNGDAYGCTARDFTSENRIGILCDDGVIKYDMNKKIYRDTSKLRKTICHDCRIAPICGGGCKQRASESNDDFTCTLGYTDAEKDNVILSIIDDSIQSYLRQGITT